MSESAQAVDELFEEFGEESPEDVAALDERQIPDDAPSAGAFENFATVPERVSQTEDDDTAVPDVDVDRLFGE